MYSSSELAISELLPLLQGRAGINIQQCYPQMGHFTIEE